MSTNIEVLLSKDFPQLGFIGDRVNVRRGFARNYLIPRGIALELSSRNAKLMNHRLAGVNARKAKLKAEAEELSKKLQAVPLEFTLKFGAHGKSFGAVGARDIEAKLAEAGFAIDKKRIRIAEAIKRVGEFKIEVRVHSEVVVPLMVKIVSDQSEMTAKEAKKAKGRRERASGRKKEASAEGQDVGSTESTENAAGEESTKTSKTRKPRAKKSESEKA